MLWGSSALSEFRTSLSKVLTLWNCVKVKQCYNNHSSVIFSIFLPECVTGLIKAEAVLPYVYHYCSQRIEAVMLAVPFTACSFCYMSKPRATLEAKIYPTFTIPKPKSFERQNSKALSLRPPKKVTSSFTTINNGRELDDIFW